MAAADIKTSPMTIRKVIEGYAYARNGNAHNPTPRVRYEVVRDGVVIDSASTFKAVRTAYPEATVVKGEFKAWEIDYEAARS